MSNRGGLSPGQWATGLSPSPWATGGLLNVLLNGWAMIGAQGSALGMGTVARSTRPSSLPWHGSRTHRYMGRGAHAVAFLCYNFPRIV